MSPSFSVSARGKYKDLPIAKFLDENFAKYSGNIESVFGFVEHTTLYGGRAFDGRELSEKDVKDLRAMDIGLRLPLTNHYVSLEEYEDAKDFLKKYHSDRNSIITVNEELATWIRRDFPLYTIESSVINNIKSLKEIDRLLKIYDQVVLHGTWNTKTTELESIVHKDRIRLFANMGCSLNCPARICYPSFSAYNKFTSSSPTTCKCSQPIIKREVSMTDFDVDSLMKLGFSKFKVLRNKGMTGY